MVSLSTFKMIVLLEAQICRITALKISNVVTYNFPGYLLILLHIDQFKRRNKNCRKSIHHGAIAEAAIRPLVKRIIPWTDFS